MPSFPLEIRKKINLNYYLMRKHRLIKIYKKENEEPMEIKVIKDRNLPGVEPFWEEDVFIGCPCCEPRIIKYYLINAAKNQKCKYAILSVATDNDGVTQYIFTRFDSDMIRRINKCIYLEERLVNTYIPIRMKFDI
jgi:hypothetical protein